MSASINCYNLHAAANYHISLHRQWWCVIAVQRHLGRSVVRPVIVFSCRCDPRPDSWWWKWDKRDRNHLNCTTCEGHQLCNTILLLNLDLEWTSSSRLPQLLREIVICNKWWLRDHSSFQSSSTWCPLCERSVNTWCPLHVGHTRPTCVVSIWWWLAFIHFNFHSKMSSVHYISVN